ncbi:uncharacterized protein LOC135941473 [Cloeon dipterum]|uniref:uncharacterized protein LOC135941473 n=1 Tax=Cloeon dipterum TaxID=197152 RepID=UPI0032202496
MSDAANDHPLQASVPKFKFNSTLQCLCMDTILESLRESSKLSLDLQNLVALPVSVRTDLLKKLAIANNGRFGADLISRLTMRSAVLALTKNCLRELNFISSKWFPSQENEYFDSTSQPFWKMMYFELYSNLEASSCNTIMKLQIGQHILGRLPSALYSCPFPTSILKMSKLFHLELPSCSLGHEQLSSLCHHLRRLVHLSCEISCNLDVEDVISVIKQSPQLEEFLFTVQQPPFPPKCRKRRHGVHEVMYNQLVHHCVKRLPFLRAVGRLVRSANSAPHLNDLCHDLCTINGRELSNRESKLEHLVVRRYMTSAQAKYHSKHAKFLELHLRSLDTQDSTTSLLELRNIEHLSIHSVGSHHRVNYELAFERLLRVFGNTLKSLSMDHALPIFSGDLYSMCPHLEKLDVVEQLAIFPERLREITYRAQYLGNRNLISLLTAPHLERLTVKFIEINLASLKLVQQFVEDEQVIAPELSYLEFKTLPNEELSFVNNVVLLALAICRKANNLRQVILTPKYLLNHRTFKLINQRALD